MTLSSTAIVTVQQAKTHLGIADDDPTFLADGIALYCNVTDATAATVTITDTTMTLVITGGTSAGTTTYTLTTAANDTLSELAAAIEALAGWTADLIGSGTALSDDLKRIPATSALGAGEELTLQYTDNARLEAVIEGVSAQVESWMDSAVNSRSVSELYPYPNNKRLALRKKPVINLTLLALETKTALSITYTGSDTFATVEVTTAAVVTRSRTGVTATTTTSTFATNTTMAAMATAINAVTGWSATVLEAGPSDLLARFGATSAKSVTLFMEAWAPFEGSSQLDEVAATLEFDTINPGWEPQDQGGWPQKTSPLPHVRVDYTAGYAAVPADITLVVLDMVADRWFAAGRDSTLQSERLGDYGYSRGAVSGTGADDIWKSRLASYMSFKP